MGGANKVKERYSRKVKGGEAGIIADMSRGVAIVREYNLGEKNVHAA
jgi:hypothetical protein